MNDDGLDIPEFLKISAARRKASWRGFVPHPSRDTTSTERWRQYERQRQEEARRKTAERIAALRMSKGKDPFYDC